jgi:ketose-bisphosphate aldolase
MQKQIQNVHPLSVLLSAAERGKYAVGSFSPRNTYMIAPTLRAGEATRSPLIIQVAQRELEWGDFSPSLFAAAFYEQIHLLKPTVPVALHLDHTWENDIIFEAIESGFTSVMIDASSRELEDNITLTREIVEYAHARGVSVEAELGRIFSADSAETESDEELFTDPVDAERFVRETGVDALAVSVGTAHGVYMVRQPKIDLPRLQAIRARTPVHLVLHGGSGVPAELMQQAIHLPGGGVSKINIATDLEQALLAELGLEARITNAALSKFSAEEIARGAEAVHQVVLDKIVNFLGSSGKADEFQPAA